MALERDGTVVAGLIYNPVTDEMFIAEKGKGAFLNDQRIRVAARTRLAEAIVACGIAHHGHGDVGLSRKEVSAVQEHVAGVRRFGAAALDLAWIAAGRLDGYWERTLKPWDMAAGLVLVREAGGFVTDCDGRDEILSKGHVVAGNEPIHKGLLSLLKTAGKDQAS
jgi:myo-inositol-1(or 4)-monophosphatase